MWLEKIHTIWWAVQVFILHGIWASDVPYSDRPRLYSENGNLYITCAADRNITLRTSGQGHININNDNLGEIVKKARDSSIKVERFQKNVLPQIHQRITTLSNTLLGSTGLKERLERLERFTRNSSSLSPDVRGKRLSRLNDTVVNLSKELASFRVMVSTDECLSNPCQNGGTCYDLINGFHCICPDSWEGKLCDTDVNECANFAGTDLGCQNKAQCINLRGSYECVCPEGYYGIHCTLRTSDCTKSSSQEMCGHGFCVNSGGNGKGFQCICKQGWTTNETSGRCEKDVNECESAHYVCSHDPLVQCINTDGGFLCGSCPPGFSGSGHYCNDIDECAENNGGCSLVPKVKCINTPGSRDCFPCPAGYHGDGITCTPAAGGRCSVDNGGCHYMATCIAAGGVVSCHCPPGYAGSGYGINGCQSTGLAIDPCQLRQGYCKNGGTCVSRTAGLHQTVICNCLPGFGGEDCSVHLSNPCQHNPCLNGGHCTITSSVSNEGFVCACEIGYSGPRCENRDNDCISTISLDSGVLSYPRSHTSALHEISQSCHWIIKVNETKAVLVQFNSINTEFTKYCSSEYVEIFDGEDSSSKSIGRFCGNTLPHRNITSNNHVISVYFHSNRPRNSEENEKFRLTFREIDPSCHTSLMIKQAGLIETPGYPNAYPSNWNCWWFLISPYGKRIKLNFYSLSLRPDQSSPCDMLKVFDGFGPHEKLIAHYCNETNPVSLVSTSRDLRINFKSDEAHQGTGFRIGYDIISGCGDVLTDATGDIVLPKYSNLEEEVYRDSEHCEWKIQLSVNEKVVLTFVQFELESCDDCSCDYMEIYDGPSTESPKMGIWCGTEKPPKWTSSSNIVTVILHTDFGINDGTFHLHYDTYCGGLYTAPSGEVMSPMYPNTKSIRTPCIYKIEQPLGKAIKLQNIDFQLVSNSDCYTDYLEIRDGDNENSTLIGKYCANDKIPDEIVSTYNHLFFRFLSMSISSQRGFKVSYSTLDLACGGIIKGAMGTISSPLEGDVYPKMVHCTWVIIAPIGHVIQLTWASFNVETGRDCRYDYVELFDNSTATAQHPSLGKYCGTSLPPTRTTIGNIMTIAFESDNSLSREGFLAHFHSLNGNKFCSGSYASLMGEIKSPNFPEEYPTNKECVYTIQVPTGKQIQLNIEKFELEFHGECGYDYLEIRNGLTEVSPLIGKYCGTDIPPNIVSITNNLYLKFVSDSSNSYSGFRILWDGTSTGCGGLLSSATGSIYSPNYPQPYGNFGSCFWKIAVSKGSKVQLTIIDIDLEDHLACNLDYIKIFDGPNIRGKLFGRYCNGNHPPHILSTNNQLYIEFVSDLSLEGRGFHLAYTTVCNTTVKGHNGVIESLNFPNPYPSDRECIWTIEAPLGNNISYSFSHFGLEEGERPYENSSDCTYDYVQLTEGNGKDPPSKSLGKFCGNELPPNNISTMDHVYVTFKSDHWSLKNPGFRLEWAVSGCGGILQRPHGTFQSPGYPGAYPHSISCEWSINVEWNNSIEITFKNVDMEQRPACFLDYVAVYGGPDDKSPCLAKLCYNKEPTIVTTSSNHAFIRFYVDSSFNGRGFIANYRMIKSKCGGLFTSSAGEIASHNYPNNYENNEECEWLIRVPQNYLINLTFVDFDIEEHTGGNFTDVVYVYDGDSRNLNVLFNHSNKLEALSSRTVISSSNTILVQFKSDSSLTAKGFKATYRMACGARIVTSGSGFISTAEAMHVEDDYTDNLNCTWYIISEDLESRVTLTFNHLDQPTYGHISEEVLCMFGNITVYDGENEEGPVLKHICGKTLPTQIRSFGHALTLSITKSNYMSFWPFEVTYSVLPTACGGVLSSERGVLISPNYPDGYPGNSECIWEIKTSPGNRAIITFTDFELESSEHCNLDYVEVRLGSANSELHSTFCGSEIPSVINASSAFWIKFSSDETGTAKGFMAEYNLMHGNEIFGIEGDIASPFYPRHSLQESFYKWVVTVDPGYVVRLTFQDMYIESGYGEPCIDNTLKIYDGRDVTASLLAKICTLEIPDPVLSHTSSVTIVFAIGQPMYAGSKFHLHWQRASLETAKTEVNHFGNCSEVVQLGLKPGFNSSYTFTSPGFPATYYNNMNCEWFLETTSDNHIVLKFNSVDLESFHDECLDYLQVFKEIEEGVGWEQLHNDVCLSNATDLSFIGSHRMRVVMITNGLVRYNGFSATAKVVCGGTIRDIAGVVDTTFLKAESVDHITKCTWTIIVRSGKSIEVSFDKMHLVSDSTCRWNYILLRNGGHNDSPVLGAGKYCGTTKPANMETISNRLFIEYSARGNVPEVVLKFKEMSESCGGDIELSPLMKSANFTSPNYPNVPPPHTTCVWRVYAPPGETVQLDFIDRFDLQSTYLCEKEYIEVRDGGTEMSPIIGDRYCIRKPSTLTSTENMLYVKYFTNILNPNNGFSAIVKIGVCGGTLNLNPWGFGLNTIRSPDYPERYPANSNCTWHVIGPEGRYLHFTLKEYSLGSLGQCTNESDYLRIAETDPTTPLSELNNKTFCGRLIPKMEAPTFAIDTNTAVIHFVSKHYQETFLPKRFVIKITMKVNTCGGSKEGSSGIIQSPGYGGTDKDKLVQFSRYCRWDITVPEGRRVTLKFLDFDLDPALNRLPYFAPRVQVFQNVFMASIISQVFKGSVPSGTTVKSSGNRMLVFYMNHFRSNYRGFKAEYSSDEPRVCGGSLEESGIINFRTKINQTYEFCYWNRTVKGISNQTFAIQVNGTFGTNVNRFCSFKSSDKTVMWFGSEPRQYNYDLGLLCSLSSTPNIITSPLPMTVITFTYVGNNESGPADFTIKYKTNPCGGVINAATMDTVVITSPGFPDNYPANIDCAWKVILPEGQINITFEVLNLEAPFSAADDKGCNDYVSIHNGPMRIDPMFDPYCGSMGGKPISILSQSNKLWIEFHSNEAEQKQGFKMRLTPVIHGCGGKYHANEGFIQSPNFPQKYPNNTECEWEIQCDQGYHIGLTFVDRFYIEKSANCVNDYVQVFDYEDGNWIPFDKICDRKQPPIYNSTSTRMKILFRSNEIIESDGFKALWNVNCGGEYNITKSGFITSPQFPRDYPDDLNCTYTLIAEKGYIDGQFEEPFVIEPFDNCKADNLTVTTYKYRKNTFVFGSINRRGIQENTYCGTQLPPPVVKQHKVVLSFVSDHYYSDTGFYFNYSVNTCGKDNMTEPGIITVPKETVYQNCLWNIYAPKGKIVSFKILTFLQVIFCQMYIEIWDGPVGSKLIEKYCGYGNAEYQSTNNTMSISFSNGFIWTVSNFVGIVDFIYDCGGVINVAKDSPYILQSLDSDNNGKYEPNLKCVWNVIAPSEFLLQVTFQKMDIKYCTNSTLCSCDFLEIYDGSTELDVKIGKFCGTGLFPTIRSSTNQLYIRFNSNAGEGKSGFQIKIETTPSPCGERMRWATPSRSQHLISPGFPEFYPHKITCQWYLESNQSNTQINLHFINLDIAKTLNCAQDRLEIKDVRAAEPQTHRICGKDSMDFLSHSNLLLLTFIKMSENTATRFNLEYTIHNCNMTFREAQGHLYNNFKSSICEIYINAPRPDDKISLYFNEFNSSELCDKSKIVVRDGQSGSSPVLLTSCGPGKPNPVFTSGNSVYIYVKFDEQGGKYDFTYTTTNKAQGCGGSLQGRRGSLSSPLYPLLHHKATDCSWNVSVPHGYFIEFVFTDFDIGVRNCSTDYVEFFGTNEETKQEWYITRFCGRVNVKCAYIKHVSIHQQEFQLLPTQPMYVT